MSATSQEQLFTNPPIGRVAHSDQYPANPNARITLPKSSTALTEKKGKNGKTPIKPLAQRLHDAILEANPPSPVDTGEEKSNDRNMLAETIPVVVADAGNANTAAPVGKLETPPTNNASPDTLHPIKDELSFDTEDVELNPVSPATNSTDAEELEFPDETDESPPAQVAATITDLPEVSEQVVTQPVAQAADLNTTIDLHDSPLGKSIRANLPNQSTQPKTTTALPDMEGLRDTLMPTRVEARKALEGIQQKYPGIDFSGDYKSQLAFYEDLTETNAQNIDRTVQDARSAGLFTKFTPEEQREKSANTSKPQDQPQTASTETANPAVDMDTISAEDFSKLLATEGANQVQLIKQLLQSQPDKAVELMREGEINLLQFSEAVGEPLAENTPPETRETIKDQSEYALGDLYQMLDETQDFSPETAQFLLEAVYIPLLLGDKGLNNSITFAQAQHQMALLSADYIAGYADTETQKITDMKNILTGIALAREQTKGSQ